MKRLRSLIKLPVYASGVLLLVTVGAVLPSQAFIPTAHREIIAAEDNVNDRDVKTDKKDSNDTQDVSTVDSCAGPYNNTTYIGFGTGLEF